MKRVDRRWKQLVLKMAAVVPVLDQSMTVEHDETVIVADKYEVSDTNASLKVEGTLQVQ